MKVLSLHSLGHDSGASYFEDGRLVFAIETERLTRDKHDHRVDLALRHLLSQECVDRKAIDLITVSSPVRNSVLRIPDLDRAMTAIRGGAPHYLTTSEMLGRRIDCVVVTHEVSHAALAAHYGGYADGCLVLVNEGKGQLTRSSLFQVQDSRLVWLDKDPLPWYGTGFGWSGIGHLLGFGKSPSVAGKVMALGAYGRPREHIRGLLAGVDARVMRDHAVAEEAGRSLAVRPEFAGGFDAMADVVATLQHMFTDAVYTLLARYVGQPAGTHVALGGGCALNIVANTYLRSRFKSDIAIPPACGDAGHPIGAALYAHKFLLGHQPQPFTVYANGTAEPTARVAETLIAAGLRPVPYNPAIVVRELTRGAVVAMVDGVAELGPRALGNRSLLGDPSRPGMRKRMSEHLKRREWFRPLGAVMRLERFEEMFPGRLPSPYMLFNYDLPDGCFPEARHADGTSRLQTVSRDQHPRLHDLLAEFERQGGAPALINTSLNASGRAIARTARDVLDDFHDSAVALFVFGDLMAFNQGRGKDGLQ